MLDNALVITVLIILITAVVGAVLARRRLDPCLRLWRGFPVTVRLDEGQVWQGRLNVYSTGFDLIAEGAGGEDPHHSHVLYQDEFSRIARLERRLAALSADERRERDRTLRQVYRPGLCRRLMRSFRMWLNTIRDAVADAVTFVAARAGGTSVGAQSGRMKSAGASLFGGAPTYDPLLEVYLGRRVETVIEAEGPDERYTGVLREYSGSFLILMDVELSGDGGEREGDVILPRPAARVRHAAEPR